MAVPLDQYHAGAIGRREGGAADLGAGRMLDKLPRFTKRNLVNTYVWTAAGGLFAEEEQTLDSVSESTGGSFSFKHLAGITASLELEIVGVGLSAELSALFGGHLDLKRPPTPGARSSCARRPTPMRTSASAGPTASSSAGRARSTPIAT